MPKISIIMGIYNCASTLDEAIASILAQTYADWQMIMCDDGSSDDTYAVAERYVKRYPDRFVLLKNEQNMGLNYTLNHCLSAAAGEYIARMDGDDISKPTRFEKQVAFLDNHPEYAIVSTPMDYFDESGVFRTGQGGGEPVRESIARTTPFCHATCMVRREAYAAVNGYTVDPKLLRVEDWHLWVKMYAKGYRGYVLSEALYQMRDDRNAASRRKFKYRIHEARVTLIAVRMLNLAKWRYLFAVRPILVGLLPKGLYQWLHTRKQK